MSGPLSGFKIIELAGIGPGPYAGQLLADMGAEILVVERPGGGLIPGSGLQSVDRRGKKSIIVDIRKPEGAAIVMKLVETADALIEGNRPGVTERLGVGPEDCHKRNPKLVYGRMTGWGQTGPWSHMAGHDINYISITGALEAMGRDGEPPFPPLNFVGDYGGGSLFLVSGILAALLKAQKTGVGEVVDAAIIDGVSSMMGIVYSLSSLGLWQTKRKANLLDGAMPYYRCYKTLDDKFMAVGCIEPQFFALMLKILEIDPESFGPQNHPKFKNAQIETLEKIFASKSRDDWAEIFADTDACVSPVLNYEEAANHPQNSARGGLKSVNGMVHPGVAPKFSSDAEPETFEICDKGEDTRSVLQSAGYPNDVIEKLLGQDVIFENKG